MNLAPRSPMLGVFLCLLAGMVAVAQAPRPVDPQSVEVSLVPDQPTVMLGEPMHLSYIVKNRSDRDLQIIVGGDYRNGLGRPDSFTVIVRGEDGMKVPQPNPGPHMGGMMVPRKVPARGTYVFRLFLPHWATFEKPGDYIISARRSLQMKEGNAEDPRDMSKGTTDLTREATTTLKVTPLDHAKLGSIIDDLARRMLRNSGGYDDRESTDALLAIRDERVIPHFLTALGTRDYSMKFQALTALSAYNSEAALEGLKEGLRTSAGSFASTRDETIGKQLANNIRNTAAFGLSRSPHPGALPFLIEQRKDSASSVRLTVVHALGNRMKVEEAIPLLEEMIGDPDERIRSEVRRYLQRLRAAPRPDGK